MTETHLKNELLQLRQRITELEKLENERKEIENALSRSEEFTISIIESSSDCIKVLDIEGRLQFMSRGGQELLKIKDIKQYLNISYENFWKGSDYQAAREAIAKAQQGGVGRFSGYCPTADGTPTWWDVVISPINGPDGNVDRLLAVSRDITERKKAEDELRKLAAELERSNSDLQQFAYIVSHDLQEPLRVASMFIKLFEKRYKNTIDKKAEELISYAVDSIGRMSVLIKDLLEYSKVETKGKALAPINCSVALEQAVFNLHVAIELSGAKLTYDLLPTIMADSTQITSLFQNLIGNSIKYRGKERPGIHISADKKGDEWLFSVRDNGIGIDSQYFEKIFDVFRRLHTREKYDGTGIGLAICKKIVERHGGKIRVESEPDKGSRFYFTIPDRQGDILTEQG
jgi:PAS domain S-box-containing protein